MRDLKSLLADVGEARRRLLDFVHPVSEEAARWKPEANEWSVAEIVEHLVLAEHAGVRRIWSAAEAAAADPGQPAPRSENAGLTIEGIVARTWKPREIAPPNATPSGEGTFGYWVVCFQACETVLDALGHRLAGMDLESVIFPHFLCGPLDARQRLEFLRFHIDRHAAQVARILALVHR